MDVPAMIVCPIADSSVWVVGPCKRVVQPTVAVQPLRRLAPDRSARLFANGRSPPRSAIRTCTQESRPRNENLQRRFVVWDRVMPHFFFDIVDGSASQQADQADEFASIDDARMHAR